MSPPFLPDWVCPPGETIKEILEDRGLTLRGFAARLGSTLTFVDGLLRGNVRIDAALARQLAEILGASERFWLNRDQQYVDDCRRLGLPLGGGA